MPQVRTTPILEWAAGSRQPVTITVTPPAGHTLAEFGSFALTIREDPLWGQRAGATAGLRLDPHADGWAVAAAASGTPDGSAVAFVVTVPAGPGSRRYAVDAWGVGGTAGGVQLVAATWLTVLPSVR